MQASRGVLVSVKWLKNLLKQKPENHRIIDASWHLPNTGRKASVEYTQQHIPGALFFDIDGCADQSSTLPHMLPSPQAFGEYVGALGINNNTHVVVYDNNPQFPIFSAQRLWWTFRVFGHNKVSILEGGLPKWLLEEGPVTSEVITVEKETFISQFNPSLVKSFEEIKENVTSREFVVIDARPAGRFQGIAPEPREDTKPGCIPNSISLPFMNTMDLKELTMKTPDELQKLFQDAGVDLNRPIVATCGSGISACILALAAYNCGKDNVAVYDGSWTEWYRDAPDDLKQNVPSE